MLTKIHNKLYNVICSKKTDISSLPQATSLISPMLYTARQNKTFLMLVIAILSKLAIIDEKVNSQEINALRTIFITFDNMDKIYEFFSESMNDNSNIKVYLESISNMYHNYQDTKLSIISSMSFFASSDSPINIYEMNLMLIASAIFKIPHNTARETILNSLLKPSKDPYRLLKITSRPSKEQLKKAYHSEIKKYHKDHNHYICSDCIQYANLYVTELTYAYKHIKMKLGYK